MVTLNVQTDIAEALKRLYKLEPRQMPFIVALAMNRTMREIKKDQRLEMAKAFDRPTPYTLNSMRTAAATKEKLEASIQPKDQGPSKALPSRYLPPQITGGRRTHKAFERALIAMGAMPSDLYAVPGKGAPLDGYGNIRGAYIRQILSYLQNGAGKGKRAQFFAITQQGKLPMGVYQRTGTMLRLVLAYVKQPSYRKRYDFYGVGERDTKRLLQVELRKAAEHAISTSKTNITASDISRAIGSLL